MPLKVPAGYTSDDVEDRTKSGPPLLDRIKDRIRSYQIALGDDWDEMHAEEAAKHGLNLPALTPEQVTRIRQAANAGDSSRGR